MVRFSVDTHLFRELGELLVGRDSTALVELVKNSYDADASVVTVWGENLRSTKGGVIRVDDDGSGMSPEQFENGFLRIASRTKEQGDRRSSRFGRRFTGAKGIGRLAAHKLARTLCINTVPEASKSTQVRRGVNARIHWDRIEQKYETLEQIGANDSATPDTDTAGRDEKPKTKDAESPLEIKYSRAPHEVRAGTQIELSNLRRRWSDTELTRFLAEVQSFQPPAMLVEAPPKTALRSKPLFETARVRDSNSNDPGFRVALEGDFSGSEEYWQTLLKATSWLIEIDAKPKQDVKVLISPTARTVEGNEDASKREYSFPHANPAAGPFFHARILVREGALQGPKPAKSWLRATTGIRVFMEGFRVLPYGEPRNDWLGLDADYTRRIGDLPALSKASITEGHVDDEGFSLLPNANYFGAVFLTEDRAKSLRMLVNREGFVPDDAFNGLVTIVRTAIDLSTRVRAAANEQARSARRKARAASKASSAANTGNSEAKHESSSESGSSSPGGPTETRGTPAHQAREALAKAVELAREARHLASHGQSTKALAHFSAALELYDEALDTYKALERDDSMLRVLASVGTQMGSFIHEVRGLLGIAHAADKALGNIRENPELPRSARGQLATVHGTLGDLRRSLERHASYLTDIVTPDARRRRSRLSIADRFDAAVRFVERSAMKRGIIIESKIPDGLKTPPMFPAELTAVFSNLLTNAVKAAGENGKIVASAEQTEQGVRVLIQNTGVKVDPSDGERWFRPFESTTTDLDPVLGQGMGLGLPITRGILEPYGADVRFVEPSSRSLSTAVQVSFPE